MSSRQAQSLQLDFPLLCDDGSVARAYGTYLELEEQGPGNSRVWCNVSLGSGTSFGLSGVSWNYWIFAMYDVDQDPQQATFWSLLLSILHTNLLEEALYEFGFKAIPRITVNECL